MSRQRGLNDNEGSNKVYITVAKGKFVQRIDEPTKTSIPRELEKGVNKGNTVHEEHRGELGGLLVSIDIENHEEFGKFWEFTFDISEDENQPKKYAVLKLKYSSGYATGIIKRFPNVNFKDDILLKGYCFMDKEKGKEVMGITTYQWDKNDKPVKILPFYTKENQNGCPQMEQIETVDGPKWDALKQLQFFENMIDKVAKPHLVGIEGSSVPTIKGPEAEPQVGDDEVPF